ncbi:hypothetical protein LJC33_00490 [Eubacteriales bacterium OttesenSCG-928-N13]|nr:hypothetical protein [Eubacteriales bacterium OttesenSCG-928-N13]
MIINMNNNNLPAQTAYSYYTYTITPQGSVGYASNKVEIERTGATIMGVYGYMRPSSASQKPFGQASGLGSVQQTGDNALSTSISWSGFGTSKIVNSNPAGTSGTIYYHLLYR